MNGEMERRAEIPSIFMTTARFIDNFRPLYVSACCSVVQSKGSCQSPSKCNLMSANGIVQMQGVLSIGRGRKRLTPNPKPTEVLPEPLSRSRQTATTSQMPLLTNKRRVCIILSLVTRANTFKLIARKLRSYPQVRSLIGPNGKHSPFYAGVRGPHEYSNFINTKGAIYSIEPSPTRITGAIPSKHMPSARAGGVCFAVSKDTVRPLKLTVTIRPQHKRSR